MAFNDLFFPKNVLLNNNITSPLVPHLKEMCVWVGGCQFGTERLLLYIYVTSKAEVTFCHLLNLLPLTRNLGRIAKLKDMKSWGIKVIIKLIMLITK